MGYYIELLDPVTKETLELDDKHNMRGSTYCVGGTKEAYLTITYNYADHYYKHIDADKGIRFIYGKTGADSIPVLKRAIEKLGDDVDSNYWISTEGNAKKALLQLLALAKLRPDGVWDGD
jgi:hypothetical protein